MRVCPDFLPLGFDRLWVVTLLHEHNPPKLS
jgi:hypothetical protein